MDLPLILPKRTDYQAYLYDCDGTLADTMPLHYQAWVAEMFARGVTLDASKIVDLIHELAGMPAEKVIAELNHRYGTKVDAHLAAEAKEERFVREYLHLVKPILPVFEHLMANRDRAKIGVVSGGRKSVVEKTLAVIGVLQYVEVIVASEDVVHGKPAPDPFLLAAQKLNVAPKDCLVFEDGELGIQSAKAAGMDWVKIETPPRSTDHVVTMEKPSK